MDGILNLHKPPGPTSFDMVRMARRVFQQRRVGHGGTLDPAAAGVLPLLLGQATRVSEYLLASDKDYLATVRLGIATDTYDAKGATVSQHDASAITRDQAEQALAKFRGVIQQTPPMYSALKQGGTPLYKLARAGIEVDRAARQITFHRLVMTEWSPPLLTLEITCSHGAYIRSLAHDLGQALGCGAHLHALTRTRVGPFTLAAATTVEALFHAAHQETLEHQLWALDWSMLAMPAAIVDPEDVRSLRYGQSLPQAPEAPAMAHDAPCRAYDFDGGLVAVLAYDQPAGAWRPSKVLPPADSAAHAASAPSSAPVDQ